MFIHQGKTRTVKHNLQIASLLSFVAGIVNVVGFLSVAKLTTNVTGHFAFFVDEVFKLQFTQSLNYLLYILFFLFGSFVSSLMIEIISRKNEVYIYIIPTTIEIIMLFIVAFLGNLYIQSFPDLIAFCLLFAMGLQNALVTRISNATVRTTHLTGLFTDLGIELAQLIFHKEPSIKSKIISSIQLRITIILFFFLGGVIAGILYSILSIQVLYIAVVTLILGLFLDNLKLKLRILNKKLHH